MVSKSWKNAGRLLTRHAGSKIIERDVGNFSFGSKIYQSYLAAHLNNDKLYVERHIRESK